MELLVALAVSSVVILIIGAFMTQGTRFLTDRVIPLTFRMNCRSYPM